MGESRGGKINRLPINQLITDINRTDITVIDSYRSVISRLRFHYRLTNMTDKYFNFYCYIIYLYISNRTLSNKTKIIELSLIKPK
jgi:hypothetical protein